MILGGFASGAGFEKLFESGPFSSGLRVHGRAYQNCHLGNDEKV